MFMYLRHVVIRAVSGSGTAGACFSDLYHLHLDPTQGWLAGTAPWGTIGSGHPPTLGSNSWAIASTNGEELFFYGQSLCPEQLSTDPSSPHPFKASSSSVQFEFSNKQWSQSQSGSNVLGPRLVKNDEPVPVQVVDDQNHVVYTFVYDAFNPQLGTQLWSFSTDHPPVDIAQSGKNTTMVTTQPPAPPSVPTPPTNGTNITEPALPPTPTPTSIVLAPFVDVGAAVYLNGTIVVIGGGKPSGQPLTGDDVDTASGYYKMDRCWVYLIATNQWSVQTLTAAGGSFPLPRRLAALLVVGTKIYMHGGNTTQTDPSDTYAKDFWILDTLTWQWSAGPSSTSGRATHTLVHFNNTLLSISGFEFETSKMKAAKNAFVMIYNLDTTTWGAQFGNIAESYFQQHSVAIIGGSVAGFILLLFAASIASRLWRKHTHKKSGASGLKRKSRPNKPFLGSAGSRSSVGPAEARKSRGSRPDSARHSGLKPGDQAINQVSQSAYETHIDLSTLPPQTQPYHQNQPVQQHQQYNPYAPVQQQQQVPLMSANALEHQEVVLEPYNDDDEPEIADPHRVLHHQ
ncbi:hypothetical protein BGX28_005653 [Mortierella sp. GBA30]|nr:hypothetical protein BGX28_005653 [Mortierella sp. GBA30]